MVLYYIKCLLFYSFLGFVLESDVYKISHSQRHSGIFYGPITEVYGFGVLALILMKRYIIDRLRCNKYIKLMVTFFLSWVVLTLIEFLGGHILNLLFDVDMWNYTKKEFNYGKYVCLELSLVWGVFGVIFVYYLKDFFDRFIELIPKKLTIVLVIINIMDTMLVLINKLKL